jgi:SHS family lactate transporter-like MFS transporter
VSVHLNELSPDTARGTFPGVVYQLGNQLASINATLQASIATHFGGNYGLALAGVAGTVALIIALLAVLGTESKGRLEGRGQPAIVTMRHILPADFERQIRM